MPAYEQEDMMKTSVIGFPRVGTLRELKFASEKYFRHEITAQELTDIAADLRHRHWVTQVAAGIDFIPCNDFSFYDIFIHIPHITEVCLDKYLTVCTICKYPVIHPVEKCLILSVHIPHQ